MLWVIFPLRRARVYVSSSRLFSTAALHEAAALILVPLCDNWCIVNGCHLQFYSLYCKPFNVAKLCIAVCYSS